MSIPVAFLPSAMFPLAALVIGLRNSSIFQAPALLRTSPLPALLLLLALGAFLVASRSSGQVRDNIPGLLLFFFFTVGYYLLATIFNKRDINTNNIYFAADSWSWLQRMAIEDGWTVGTRAVHPLTPILFRPLVWLLSFLTGGDRFYATLIFLALAGGGCVFCMWKIMKWVAQDQLFGILFASLLGLSASHLIFASVIETYIFSALLLILFIWLLLSNYPHYLLIGTGLLTLGITVTNILQQGLAALFIRRNLRRLIAVLAYVVLLAIGLNILSHSLYPVPYFFLPQNLREEQAFLQELNLKRVGLMAENLLIYNITAPQPYESLRREMPRFNFFTGTIKSYAWFGWPALILWMLTLGLAFFFFLKNIRSDFHQKYLALAMLSCLLVNLLVHIGYGVEPFLYSADWTYALILFTAVSLSRFVGQTWLKAMLFVLVLAIFINNLGFMYSLARKVSEYLA